MDWKIELLGIPVTDVDRAKSFYVEKAGFNADHDHTVNEQLRFVQLTPPGSACSIVLGTGITTSPPGTAQVQIVVANVDDARAELLQRDVEVSDVQVFDWGRFVFFEDPDGNKWALQELLGSFCVAPKLERPVTDLTVSPWRVTPQRVYSEDTLKPANSAALGL